jgi:hypothetical protein
MLRRWAAERQNSSEFEPRRELPNVTPGGYTLAARLN